VAPSQHGMIGSQFKEKDADSRYSFANMWDGGPWKVDTVIPSFYAVFVEQVPMS
jgi:hypothetical protein